MKITIESNELSKDDLQVLLQALRDCERQHFKDKYLFIRAEAPELGQEEISEVLASLKPPPDHGPFWSETMQAWLSSL